MDRVADMKLEGARRHLGWLGWAAAGTLLFLLQLNLGTPPQSIGLDSSWSAVLGWAAANDVVWGRDLVFTFGPLGYLYPGATYIADTFVAYFTAQIVLGLVVCFGLLHAARERSAATRAALAAVFFVWWLPWGHPDSLWFLFFLASHAAIEGMIRRDASSRALWLAVGAYTAAVALAALMKFSMLPLSAMWAGATIVALCAHGRTRYAIGLALVYTTTTVVGWVAGGQPATSALDYLQGATAMSAGYVHGMSIVPPLNADLVGVATLVGTGLVLFALAVRNRRDISALASLALASAVVVIAWRAGYTRADGHMVVFYPVAFSALLLFFSLRPGGGRWWLPLLALAVAGASLAALPLFRSTGAGQLLADRFAEVGPRIRGLVQPHRLRGQREAELAEAARLNSISDIRARAGTGTLDVFSWEQGLVLVHGMNYKPRPVFQGYAAYTAALSERNRDFLRGPDAPEFALLRIQAIDGRLPMADDSLSLIELLTGYMPVTEQNGFVLLAKRRPAPLPAIGPTRQTVRMNQWVTAPALRDGGSVLILRVDVRGTLAGRLYALALRGAPLALDTQTTEGRTETWRIIPDAARAGFVVSPVLRDNNDFLDWYGERANARALRRVRVRPMFVPHARFFEDEVSISFEERPVLRPSGGEENRALSLSGSASIRPAPMRRWGIIERLVEDGRPSLFMHAPAEMVFSIPEGRHEFSATFGIRSDALTSPGCEPADGVTFWVGRKDGTEIYSRHVDPFSKRADRGAQRVQGIAFSVDTPTTVALRVMPGKPGANTACDWGYVRDLQITPTGEGSRARPGGD